MYWTLTLCSVMLFILTLNSKAKVISRIKALVDDMNKDKHELLATEDHLAVGSSIQLDENEIKANEILMSWKYKELDESFNNPKYFNFSKHYLLYREHINNSKVYQIIKKMPKGAALHLHDTFVLNIDYILTFMPRDNLYICFKIDKDADKWLRQDTADFEEEDFNILYSDKKPTLSCKHKWMTLDWARYQYRDTSKFDTKINGLFSLYYRNRASLIYGDSNSIWKTFEMVEKNMKTLSSYWMMKTGFIIGTLRKLYQDNILYAELRTNLDEMYEEDGNFTDRENLMRTYKGIIRDFKRENPDFIGLKLIITRDRNLNREQMENGLMLATQMNEMYPGLIAGFDLVGQEDQGEPLSYFLPLLFEYSEDIDYYLHAGESNWNMRSIDENMFDAVVLGSKRIGHAYGLAKHPSLIQAIADKNIAIEANVISNNIFGLVKDMRNHPLATYLSVGLPVVLSSDYPGAWGADPLSHDFFVTFMAIANKHAGLRLLKQLALNSIHHSSLDVNQKTKFLEVFDKRWKQFIYELISLPESSMHSPS